MYIYSYTIYEYVSIFSRFMNLLFTSIDVSLSCQPLPVSELLLPSAYVRIPLAVISTQAAFLTMYLLRAGVVPDAIPTGVLPRSRI